MRFGQDCDGEAMNKVDALSAWEKFPEQMKKSGLRLTRQRLFLAELLFKDQKNRHVTAASLVKKAKQQGISISLATIYNTLRQFVELGLLSQVSIGNKAAYFDTNLRDHHHFFHEENGELIDIDRSAVGINGIPEPPADTCIKSVDVVIYLQNKNQQK